MIFFTFMWESSGHASWTWSKCLWWWDGDFIFFGNFLFFGFSYVISLGGRVWKKLIGKLSKWFFMIFLLLCGNHLGMLTKCCLWVCNVEMVFLQFLRIFYFFGFSYVISLGDRVWKKLIGKSSKWFFYDFWLFTDTHLGMLLRHCHYVSKVEMVILYFFGIFLFFWIFVCNQLGG